MLSALLQNQIDITRVPFSDRGSRILIFKYLARPCLYIKLAERLINVEPGIESYLHRPPYLEELYFIDSHGQILEFELVTAADALQFQTPIGLFQLTFQNSNTLVFGFPAHRRCGIRFRANTSHWSGTSDGGAIQQVRNVSYKILNGTIITNNPKVEILVQTTEDCSMALHIGDDTQENHEVKPFSIALKESKRRWNEWFDRAPVVKEKYRHKYAYAWWVMGNNIISPQGFITRPAMVPSKASYVGTWLWDSALHAIAYRHIDAELARDQVRVMLAQQLPDGMLPDAIFDEGIVAEIGHPIPGRVTKPPILAWAVTKIHEMHPDLDFLSEVYEPLSRENKWWFEYNDDDKNGIVQYKHPYSSGLDDSPLWDHGLPVESPDINTYLQIQMMSLSKIAAWIGRTEEAKRWRQKAGALTQLMVQRFWDEKSGTFRALHNEKDIPVMTPFNLLPLWTGQLSDRLNRRLMEHLENPAEFMGRFGLPTVAYNDPAYSPDKMWRGPVWANINYFFIEALQNVGYHGLAKGLRERTLNLITSQPGISEYYDSSTGNIPATAVQAFGWTAAVFIELAIQAGREN